MEKVQQIRKAKVKKKKSTNIENNVKKKKRKEWRKKITGKVHPNS